MKSLLTLLKVVVLLLISAANAYAAYSFSGELRQDDETLFVPNSGYVDAVFGWTVDYNQNEDYWTYAYSFTNTNTGRDVSHIDIEVSENFDLDLSVDFESAVTGWENTGGDSDLLSWESNVTINYFEGATEFSETGGDIFGIKWEPGVDTKALTLTIATTRAPMWGDVYVKDGNDGPIYAVNKFFGDDPGNDPITDGNNGGWALVPDTGTHLVPIPTTLLLLGSGLIGLIGIRRKFMK